MTKSTLPILALIALVTAGCTIGPTPLTSYATTVDCGAGQSINSAIAAGYTQITVRGVCDESVEIAVDGITLMADPAGATIAPTSGDPAVWMRGASNTELRGLTLDGANSANHTVEMRHSDVIMQDVTVTGGKAAGIYVSTNSSANVQGSELRANDTAMTVINNSYANVTGETRIVDSKFIALISSRASSVTFGGGSVIDGVQNGVGIAVAASAHLRMREGAVVTNVNGRGVEAEGASVEVSEASITAVSGDAIQAVAASSVMLDRATITGNGGWGVRMDGSSGGRYWGSTITGNAGGALSISPDSEFRDAGGNTVGP
jgi:hypothetical protein